MLRSFGAGSKRCELHYKKEQDPILTDWRLLFYLFPYLLHQVLIPFCDDVFIIDVFINIVRNMSR